MHLRVALGSSPQLCERRGWDWPGAIEFSRWPAGHIETKLERRSTRAVDLEAEEPYQERR